MVVTSARYGVTLIASPRWPARPPAPGLGIVTRPAEEVLQRNRNTVPVPETDLVCATARLRQGPASTSHEKRISAIVTESTTSSNTLLRLAQPHGGSQRS